MRGQGDLRQERAKRGLLLTAGPFYGRPGRLQPGAVLLGKSDSLGQRESRRGGFEIGDRGGNFGRLAAIPGPANRVDRVDIRVRSNPEASLYTRLGELLRHWGRPVPQAARREKQNYEGSGAAESLPIRNIHVGLRG